MSSIAAGERAERACVNGRVGRDGVGREVGVEHGGVKGAEDVRACARGECAKEMTQTRVNTV